MATLQSSNSPGSRIAAGDSIIAAAKSVDVKPIQKRFEAFKKVHTAYLAAHAKVLQADEAVRKQQAKVAEGDVTQDEDVLDLATGLAGDGFPRLNPFKPFGAPPPAKLCALGYGEEAKQVLALEKAVAKKKGVSPATLTKAKKAAASARKVQEALKPIAKLEKVRTDARHTRGALEQAWETAFAALKRAARTAEDDGANGLFAALFDRTPKPVKAKGKTAKDKAEGADAEAEAPAKGDAGKSKTGKTANGAATKTAKTKPAKGEAAKPKPAKPANDETDDAESDEESAPADDSE